MNRSSRIICLALALAALGTPVGAAPAKVAAVKTVLIPSETNPLVAIRVFFRVGSASDPKGKEGLAGLTAAMLGKGGSTARSYAEGLDALYPLAARIGFYGDKESFVFTGTVHRDNLDRYAELLADQVVSPRFADEDFQRNRQDALDFVTKTLRGNDDESLGKQTLGTMLYKGHPYGHPTRGTEAGLKAITLADVKTFYAQHFTRDNLIIGVAGGYPADFPERFVKRFDALAAKGKPLPKLPTPVSRKGAEIVLVDKDASSTAVSIGHPLRLTRADDDFYPLTVARSYLGEHRTFNGVLMTHMRGLRGLNYGDYAYIENFIQEGGSTFPVPNVPRRQQHFEIWLRPIAARNALFAVREAMYETDKLWRQGIPAEGFEQTRQFLINYARLWTQDASRRLGYAIDAEVYGKDLVGELEKRLPAMTKADVDRVVHKYLDPKHWAAALVTTKADEVKATLVGGKPTPIVYDTEGTPPAVLEEDKIIEKFALPVSASATRVVPVDQMFAR